MEGVTAASFFTGISLAYKSFVATLPFWAQNFINLFLLVFVVVIYSMFIWWFYRLMARKDLFSFDISQFQKPNNPFANKLIAAFFYFLKNIIIYPLLIFFWYAAFTIFLVMLTEGLELNRILIISAIIIAAIRGTAYYREGLSRDLAKLLPFTLLTIAITQSNVLNFGEVLSNLGQIPNLLKEVSLYYLFIIILEGILRISDIFFLTSGMENQEEIKEE